MKTRQQSLHDEGWQSRAGKEGDAQKLDDVRVAEGAHKLSFIHDLRPTRQMSSAGTPVECTMELFRGTDGSRHGHFAYSAEGSSANAVFRTSDISKCFSSGNCSANCSAMIFCWPWKSS